MPQPANPAIARQSGTYGVDYAGNYYVNVGGWQFLSPTLDAAELEQAREHLSLGKSVARAEPVLTRKMEDAMMADAERKGVPNLFAVGSSGTHIRVLLPANRHLTRAEALNLAVWLVVCADACGTDDARAEFDTLYREATR